MNTPNKLTLLRIGLIFFFLISLYWEFPGHRFVAVGIFLLASVTDFVDGYLARKYNQVTDFGKFMDPLADKILVVSAMVFLVEAHRMPAWVLLVVVTREFAVTALRLVAVEGARVISAGLSGKIKTAATMVACTLMLLSIPEWLNGACVLVILVTTVASGVDYFFANRDLLRFSA